MATAQQALDAANAALNSYQSLSNSVSAQLAEQSTVLSDYADHLKNGSSPDPAILDTVVQQMGNLKKSVDETNQQVQDNIAVLQATDPGPVTPPQPLSTPGPVPGPVSPANPGDQPEKVVGNPVGTGGPNTPVLEGEGKKKK